MDKITDSASLGEAKESGVTDIGKPMVTAIPPFVLTEHDFKKIMRLNTQRKRDGVLSLAARKWFKEIPTSPSPAAENPQMKLHAENISSRRFYASLTYTAKDGQVTEWALTNI